MDNQQNGPRLYPMKNVWQVVNQVLGFWSWLTAFYSIIGFDFLFFKWPKKVIPAFRKMMAAEPKSYLRISSKGLEYHNWPFFELRCKWDDVQRINRGRWLGDTLYLKYAEEIGFSEFSVNLGQRQIHLSSLVGWPDGGLEDDLRQYAPQLFRG